MSSASFNAGLLEFLGASPTPFHAVARLEADLAASGFAKLDESDNWSLVPAGKYFITRNGSALVAFRLGSRHGCESGIHLAGAHTDSPCLKLKPVPEITSNGYLQLGVEVYGGALLGPWFDRDLSVAGRVSFLTSKGEVESALVDLVEPVATIPSLAIHLDREVNNLRSINAQLQLPPIVLQLQENEKFSFDELLLQQLHRTGHQEALTVLAHELCLYDTQKPAITGLRQQFIASARLDNLLSCYLICQSLKQCNGDYHSLIVCNDHEEVGSTSTSGAQGPFLEAVLRRIVAAECNDAEGVDRMEHMEHMEQMLRKSLMLSVDNAHGIHPNYADRHDARHGPLLNGGPVIKINANQRYASNSESVARFKAYCEKAGIKTQSFAMRSDMACGSTIGPLTAARIGITTVDVGAPTFAMHSIRELAGTEDGFALSKATTAFYNRS